MACFYKVSNHFLTVLSVFLLLSSQAMAQTDAAGAKKLQTAFHKLLEKNEKTYESYGYKVQFSRPVMVEPNGPYYAVTIPSTSIVTSDNIKTELSTIAVNAKETPQKGVWALTMALPKTISSYNDMGVAVIAIKIGAQQFNALFDENLVELTDVKTKYSNVQFKNSIQDFTGSINNISIDRKIIKKDGANNYQENITVTASGLDAQNALGDKSSFGKLEFISEMPDISIYPTPQKKNNIFNLMPFAGAVDYPIFTSKEIENFNLPISYKNNAGIKLKYNFENFKLIPHTASKTKEFINPIHLLNGSIDFNVSGTPENAAVQLVVKANADPAMRIDAQNQFMPENLNIDITAQNVPIKQFVAAGKVKNKTEQHAPLAILSAANSNILIKDTLAMNKLNGIQLKSHLLADNSASHKVTGSFDLSVLNMNNIIQNLQKELRNPNSVVSKETLEAAILQFTILSTMGQKSVGQNGSEITSFAFSLDKDGTVRLNGQDISPLIESFKN